MIVPNQFQLQSGSIPLSELDDNFLQAWMVRDYTYATTTGSANVQVLTLPAGVQYSALTDGDTFQFKAGFTNTGPMTLQIIGSSTLPAKQIFALGNQLSGGDIVAGRIYTVSFDGTQFELPALQAHNLTTDPVSLAWIGDSLSAQNALLETEITVHFEQAMNSLGANVKIHNLSIAGCSFYRANTLPEFGGNTAVQQAISISPQMVVISLGINDTITQVDGRSLVQVEADAATTFSTLRAALPSAKIVYSNEIPYDVVNFTPSTAKNKGVIPYLFTLPAAGILTNCYTPEMLDTVISAGNQTLLSNFNALDDYIRTTIIPDGVIGYNHWKVARLGCFTLDGLHLDKMGILLRMAYMLKGMRTLSFAGTLFPTLAQQTNAILYDPDALFSATLTASGDGYTTTIPENQSSGRVTTDGAAVYRYLNTDTWFYPYKTRYMHNPASISADGLLVVYNQCFNGPPNTAINISKNGAAFSASGISTDDYGYFLNVAEGWSLAGGVPGTYTFRYQIGNEVYGPFTLTVTASTTSYVKVRQVAAASIAGTFTVVHWDTIDTDRGSNWNSPGNDFVAPGPGLYAVNCQMKGVGGTVGDVLIPCIFVNGTQVIAGLGGATAATAEPCWGSVSGTLLLATGSTVQIQAIAAGTAPMNTSPGAANVACVLTIAWSGF